MTEQFTDCLTVLYINDCLLYYFEGDNIIGRDGKCNITVPIKVSHIQHFHLSCNPSSILLNR